MNEKFEIKAEDITFNADGTVTIKNAELKLRIETDFQNSDIFKSDTNNGCGNDIVCPGPKINILCNESILQKNDITILPDDRINIRNTKFNTDILKDKLEGFKDGKINLGISGYKKV